MGARVVVNILWAACEPNGDTSHNAMSERLSSGTKPRRTCVRTVPSTVRLLINLSRSPRVVPCSNL